MSTEIKKAHSLINSFSWSSPPNVGLTGRNIEFTYGIITPDLAKVLLKISIQNRPVKNDNVDSIALSMKTGKWRINGDSICIDEDGYLIDGQHRLRAVIQSGIPAVFLFQRGFVREDAFWTKDSGSKRSTCDRLRQRGFVNTIYLVHLL